MRSTIRKTGKSARTRQIDKPASTRHADKPARKSVTGIIMRAFIAICIAAFLCGVSVFAVHAYMRSFVKSYIVSVVDEAAVCDVILILGARVYGGGVPSNVLQDRLDYGYALYAAGKAGKIIVSGDHGQMNYDEVNAMKDYLVGKGVPRADIFMDHAGFNTYDSMYRAKEIFCAGSMLISTQEFHIDRSVYIARKLGIDAYGYPCPDKTQYGMLMQNLRESVARAKAVFDVLVKRKPKYLGEKIPFAGDGSATDG